MTQFRPISLCNMLYKILAKAIANQLRGIIGKCIDNAQSAFVLGRLISDNVLLAYEILHMLRKRLGKKGYMTVKLDMSKAYDRVEWNFVNEIMIWIGFDKCWVDTLMKCVTTVSYLVVINGYIEDKFLPTRGLRQGDPLSPFLFLLCGEGLSSLLILELNGRFSKGVKVSRSGPKASHLFFANSCIVFGEATSKGANLFKDILREYKSCSGQYVNFDKSIVFFSKNTSEEDRRLVVNLLGGGKEAFIKAILQAIPTYTMACFLLPKVLCNELESFVARFLWQKGHGKMGIDWYRKVISNDRCLHGCSSAEDSLHIFRECPTTTKAWQCLHLSWVKNNMNQSTLEWLTWVFKKGNDAQYRILCYALWEIWFSRNQLLHEGKNITGKALAQNVQRHTAEYEE
ncbi:hypothetical protein J1N35_007388 [Gossypium stocksii]|uniref:Reverse transcriptase domain-containing protein n=1 Tax=Gossypium stocksii TaxID=47602 RepID=A0A9D3W928_9ROSI|nr:hypothetical protein J1N35_007388 [Gossypium stocksii]